MNNEVILTYDFYDIKLTHVKGDVSPDFFEKIPHSHEHCEVFIHVTGEMDIFVEKSVYHLHGGEVRIYSSGELHCGSIVKTQKMEWYQITIPKSFAEYCDGEKLMRLFTERNPGTKNVFVSEKQYEIKQMLIRIFSYYNSGNELKECYCRSAVINILCLLNMHRCYEETSIHQNRNFNNMISVINLHYKDILTVEDICNITHYSASYINRLFRKNINISPYQFLLGKKLDEAKKMLRAGNTVTEACEMAGFNDYANFITLFRKKFGMTPKKYSVLKVKYD